MNAILRTFALCLLLLPAWASARETIEDFSVTLQVLADGKLLVTERIRVRAEGQQIKRGIYRDVPLSYREAYGLLHRAPVTLLSVTRDDLYEPVRSERNGSWQRFYLGASNVVLMPGEYSYELRYQVERALLWHADTDELYWNVTGNQWSFPIANASVEVLLPAGVQISNLHAYTGSSGATEQAYQVLEQQDNWVRLKTNAPLGSYQGLTVALEWPAGVIARPSTSTRLVHVLGDNLGLLVGALTVLGLGIFYHLVWRRVGRDPAKGLVVPLFQAPDGMPPAMAGYLWHRGFGGRFSAAKALSTWLTQMAISRHLSIAEEDPGKSFILTRGTAPLSLLPDHAQHMCNALFADSNAQEPLEIAHTFEPRLAAAMARLKRYLQVHSAKWYTANLGWWASGVVAAVAGALLMLLLSVDAVDFMATAGGLLFAGMFALAVILLVKVACSASTWRGRIIPGLFALLMCWPVSFGLHILGTSSTLPITLLLSSLLLLVLVYRILLPAPSKEGRALLDQLEGYRDYLSLAETEVLAMAGKAPAMTIAHYEMHLPYAMALGVEEQWTERFATVLNRGLTDASQPDYQPAWYHSQGLRVSPVAMSKALAMGLADVAALSSSPPSRAGGGGSSGGGFSGGGRGGGGGGGW
ncbi:DUF2207 domain-containing protein [Pseudomonas sp. 5P_3.1_Bac2]|uniref:DUF2207 domain-containing protein n=1 Tax=Pseudomonas sp. 5P_3.1_Bac2 TaxID=2971617 RepID=UPI0021C849E9|nr:DUF2207 domain-containing protein [Pseudomonas sp. 5P_3.1_Bac2]MCU1719179.1 DUF2207 domain-containing protein [Pseudomonas sp. 5P_3.1_Bac2]